MEKKYIYMVSDSTGITAGNLTRTVISQFGLDNIEFKRIPNLITKSQIRDVVSSAASDQAMIFFTLVVPELERVMLSEAARHDVIVYNILGTAIEKTADFLGEKPILKPGLNHQLDEKYFEKIKAMEFTLKFDDLNDNFGIENADIVLIGISRTSKTPLCIYLSYLGYKAANVPLVPEVELSEAVLENEDHKVIGLTIDPLILNEIRIERLKAMGLGDDAEYADSERINEELDYAKNMMEKIGCPVIDVSHKTIEQTAAELLSYF